MSPFIGLVTGLGQFIRAMGQYLMRCGNPPGVDLPGTSRDSLARLARMASTLRAISQKNHTRDAGPLLRELRHNEIGLIHIYV